MSISTKIKQTNIREFLKTHYKHFNSAVVVEAAQGWCDHLSKGGKMLLSMAGAMSTAEIGISLAEMIRQGKVDAICTTGANLEEDIFNLVAHDDYKRIPDYRSLNAQDEVALRDEGFNRVTDTCIPEEADMRKIERKILKVWQQADKEKKSYFPYEFIYQLIKAGDLKEVYQANPDNSWVIAACEKNIPIFTPGWEDSTLGNFIVANHLQNNISTLGIVKSGLEQMRALIEWYRSTSTARDIGFFQIGGGIAGDFAICVVPLIRQDLKESEVKLWQYFAQISDSTTSYGSYSGASPSEKISWAKLDPEAPRFIIESDASIVAPLIFSYVLDQ